MQDRKYMMLAIKQAKMAVQKGEIPVGAIIVKDDKIIAKAHNLKETKVNPLAHAEMLAIQKALKKLGSMYLTDCTIYVTLEPCPMCAGSMLLSRMTRLVYACPESKLGAAESLFNIVDNNNINHRLEVRAGVCEQESKQILQEFFKQKR